jgi:hypothetical protein
MMKELEPGERVYHRDDPCGPRGEVQEVRDFGEGRVRALVKWDTGSSVPTWSGVEYLREAA